MPRTKRYCPGGVVLHVLDRGVGRTMLFSTGRDYWAFEETVEETREHYPMRSVAYCWMPNHGHFVLWPEKNDQLFAFVQRLTNTHTQRWQRAKQKVGYGHLYQGRFKSFPVQPDEPFCSVVRYVARNALRASLGSSHRAAAWPHVHPPPPRASQNETVNMTPHRAAAPPSRYSWSL